MTSFKHLEINDADINTKFLHFFQDSTLQSMLLDVQQQYTEIDDLNESFSAAFERLAELLPSVKIPEIYTQIGSFDQSIIVGNNVLGISLDKYLGSNYPFYQDHYTDEQRRMMERSMIVPDAISFYLLSLFPTPDSLQETQAVRDRHMSRIHWVVQQVTDQSIFDSEQVAAVERYMQQHPAVTVRQLLSSK